MPWLCSDRLVKSGILATTFLCNFWSRPRLWSEPPGPKEYICNPSRMLGYVHVRIKAIVCLRHFYSIHESQTWILLTKNQTSCSSLVSLLGSGSNSSRPISSKEAEGRCSKPIRKYVVFPSSSPKSSNLTNLSIHHFILRVASLSKKLITRMRNKLMTIITIITITILYYLVCHLLKIKNLNLISWKKVINRN